MTRADFDLQCQTLCKNCRAGFVVRLRPETGEWVHDQSVDRPGAFAHSLCVANDFRKTAVIDG